MRPEWRTALAVAALALAVTASGASNGFSYDDVGLIVDDPALHDLSMALPRAFSPYMGGQLLRPVPLLGFAAQWTIGGGSPMVFRVVSLALYALVSVLVFQLGRQCGASPRAALFSGLLFAAHPVHSEVTANGVGQLELLAAAAVIGAVMVYLRARARTEWRRRDTVFLAVLYLIATHTKESAYILPGLLLAAELSVVRDPRGWRGRVALLREPALTLVMVMVGSLAIRNHFLGSLGGGMAHPSLEGMGIGARAVAVLALVPEWFRLLFWPARLQAEYGPPALDPTAPAGITHLLGLALVVATAIALVWSYRRAPLLTLGVAWTSLALAPTANLFFPTGIILAERTLFLPSVGLALAVAGVLTVLEPMVRDRRRIMATACVSGGIVLIAAGWRTAVRQPEWRDTITVMSHAITSSPNTYRAHMMLGRELQRQGRLPEAESSFRRAAELWNRDPRPFEEIGQLLRRRGDCRSAIPWLEQGVQADTTADIARSRLVECLIVERQWDRAESTAAAGLRQGVEAYRHALDRITAGRAQGIP